MEGESPEQSKRELSREVGESVEGKCVLEQRHLAPHSPWQSDIQAVFPPPLPGTSVGFPTPRAVSRARVFPPFPPDQGTKHILGCVWFRHAWPADSHTARFSPGCGSSPGAPESCRWWGDSCPAPAPATSHDHTDCCSDEESHYRWSVHSETSSETETQTVQQFWQEHPGLGEELLAGVTLSQLPPFQTNHQVHTDDQSDWTDVPNRDSSKSNHASCLQKRTEVKCSPWSPVL